MCNQTQFALRSLSNLCKLVTPNSQLPLKSHITRAVRRQEVKVSVALSNSFFYFLGRDGPRDKTSGHELLFSVSCFVPGWHELTVIKFFAFFVRGPS